MVKFKKTSWLILGLSLVIAAAVFVNWQFIKNETSDKSKENEDKILGEQSYVNAEDSYVDNARYTREQSRNEAISVLKTIADNENADAETRMAASEDISGYAKRAEMETSIENQIKAKGFEECIVFLGADNASIVVKTEGLEPAEAAQITDIVVAETGFSAAVVKIIELSQ